MTLETKQGRLTIRDFDDKEAQSPSINANTPPPLPTHPIPSLPHAIGAAGVRCRDDPGDQAAADGDHRQRQLPRAAGEQLPNVK